MRSIARSIGLLAISGTVACAQSSIDLLRLSQSELNGALPLDWGAHAVRGQLSPKSSILDSAGARYLRLSGTSRAAFFVRQLDMPLRPGGLLAWRWRVPLAPVGARMDAEASNDAALRVFVVFARRSVFERTPRSLFYTLADGAPPAVSRTAKRPPIATIPCGRPALAKDWLAVVADPFADYRRLWNEDAGRIVAIGVMQDTDQTGSAAIGDLMDLQWRTVDAARD